MAQINLPENSKINKGKYFKDKTGSKNLRKVNVYVNGHKAPVVGRVCMDLTAVDVTGLNVKVGDPVELFGDNIPIESVSDAADTIPYELIARVHQRVIRRIV